jgi:hypothetical protein
MFIVVSLDFGGNTDVGIHCCTNDQSKAFLMYEFLCAKHKEYNNKYDKDGVKVLVDLLQLPDELCSLDGAIAFWGKLPSDVKRLASNN